LVKVAGTLSLLLFSAASAVQAQQFWRTDGTPGTWITGTNWGATALPTGGSAYTANSAVRFTANSTVTFATGSIGNVTVDDGFTVTVTSAGTLTTNGAVRTFDIGTGSTLTWTSQNVSNNSTSGFIKNGAGIWNIGAQANGYTGGFTLNNGTVIVSGNSSFGGSGSLLTVNGGTIQSSGTRAYANSVTLGGNFTNTGTGNATFSGTVGLGGATRTITNSTTSGSRIYSGIISGTSGSGLTFDGAGAGQTYIGSASNSFTGTITINGGEVGFASDGALGNTANTIVVDGGRLTSSTTGGNAVTSAWSSTHNIQVGDTVGTAISVQSAAGDLTYDGIISNVTAKTGAWAKQGSGILRLGGVSTYTGNTAINNGIVQLTTGNNRLPTGTVVSLGQAASANVGTLDLNSRDQQIFGLNSTTGTNATASNNTVTSVGTATLTIGGTGTYSYGDGSNTNSGIITGAISLVKQGSGTQTLGDANTYTGATLVSTGTLLVNGDQSASTGDVTVAVGATLGGIGTIGGDTIVNGTLSTGALAATGSVGTLTLAGVNTDLTFANGSMWLIDLMQDMTTPSADRVTVGGTFTVGASDITFNTLGTYFEGNSFTLASYTSRTGFFDNYAASGNYLIGGNNYYLDYGATTITLTAQAVPEPAAFIPLLPLLLAGLWFVRRRKMQQAQAAAY